MSVAMMISLAACGSEKKDEVSSQAEETQTVSTEVKVGALFGPTGVSMAKLAMEKVLLHDMRSIETLARVDMICVDKTGFGLPAALTPWLGCGTFLVSLTLFFLWHSRRGASSPTAA